MPLTVHHLQVSQSERIVWLCEELGVNYELKLHKRSPLLSPPEIKALNPLGAAPVMEDRLNGKQVRIAESGAIAEYICRVHGGGKLLLDPSHPDYADFLYWFHASNGTVQAVMSRMMSLRMADPTMETAASKSYLGRRSLALQVVNDRLATAKWLAGDEFTAADIMSLFSFTTMRTFIDCDLTGYDNILAWMKRCAERPAYVSAMQKGDPDMDWRAGLSAQGPPKFKGIENLGR